MPDDRWHAPVDLDQHRDEAALHLGFPDMLTRALLAAGVGLTQLAADARNSYGAA